MMQGLIAFLDEVIRRLRAFLDEVIDAMPYPFALLIGALGYMALWLSIYVLVYELIARARGC